MAEPAKLRCWIVSTQWSCGTGGISIVCSPSDVGAAGVAMMQTMRGDPAPTGDLIAIMGKEITVAELKHLAAMVESGQPQTATVLSLVPAAEAAPPAESPSLPEPPDTVA